MTEAPHDWQGPAADGSTPASLNLTGRQLGDYRVLRRLGIGGMAEVYLAEQCSLGRQVALKVLLRHLAEDATYVERFQNEARAAASLVHANIVQIHEVGQAEGLHFIAQEYVRGKNLGVILRQQGSLEPRLILDIMRQVSAALCKADELGIVHRDIKPENIMLSHSGEVKVADFGLARVQDTDNRNLTQVGVTMGTPLYMSPEQIESRALDSRSDIYSLGITCYHLLAGRPPHRGETALSIAVQHLNSRPEPLENARPEVPSGLARIIHRMIAKQPEKRYANPAELMVGLRDLAASAAQEGWAEGPEEWSLAEWVALQESRSQATAQLDQLMKASATIDPDRIRPGRWVALLLATALGGVMLAWITMPRFYLDGAVSEQVERRSSPWAQLYHAKMTPSEAAWEAVWKEFDEVDPYLQQLAEQGLIRYYLLVTEEYSKALHYARQLEEEASDADEPLQSFTQAALYIAYQGLEKYGQAADAADNLPSEKRDLLRRSDPQMYEMLESALDNPAR
jgi:eukaryotic-like serine/threonine-protein kinase